MFFYMIISCTCCRHLGPPNLSLMNTKNQPNDIKKKSFSLKSFWTGFCNLQKIMLYTIESNESYEYCQT